MAGRESLTGVLHLFVNLTEDVQGRCGSLGEEEVPEGVQRGNLDQRPKELLGELLHFVDLLLTRSFAGLILALESQEAELRMLRQTRDALASL